MQTIEPYNQVFCTQSNNSNNIIVLPSLINLCNLARETFYSFRIKDILGSGAFGTVHRGLWHHSEGNESVEEEVAVKSIEDGASEEERVKFLQEAAIMGQFKHPNIIRIIGVITEQTVS